MCDGLCVGVVECGTALEKPAFNELDQAFLVSLASKVLLVMSCIKHFQETIPPRQVLQMVQEALHPGLSLAASVRAVLTGVTAGQGLGFSRAMVFAPQGDKLRLLVAVGALTRQDAQDTWATLERDLSQRRAQNRIAGEHGDNQAEQSFIFLLNAAIAFAGRAESESLVSPLEEFLRGRLPRKGPTARSRSPSRASTRRPRPRSKLRPISWRATMS